MYSVMIVDDEKAIRSNLPHVLDFAELGFQVSAVAKNGRDAMTQLEQSPVDLVFLDVCMPVLDGIGFLRELSAWEETRRPFVVMLSGYSEFEYARAAIQYGVKGYLLKPIDEDEAGALLTKLRTELDARSREQAGSGIGERVRLLRELYHGGTVDREKFQTDLLLHVIALSGDPDGVLSALREAVEKQIPGGAEAFLRSGGNSMATYLLPRAALEDAQNSAMLYGRHVLRLAEREGGACALLFDGLIFRQPEKSFRTDYETHLYQMASELFWGGGSVLSAENEPRQLTPLSEKRLENEEELLSRIRRAAREADGKELLAAFEELSGKLEERRTHVMLLQELCYRIPYALADVLSEESAGEISLRPLDFRDASVFPRFADWKKRLWDQLSAVLDGQKKTGAPEKEGLAGQAAGYVRAHFREPITLKSVADACFVSSAHLSRCFQKEMGVSLKQYLNDLRLREAKRLLLETNLRIYEIAEAAGFGESKYFVSKFTAACGCTPAEYRRKESGEENRQA